MCQFLSPGTTLYSPCQWLHIWMSHGTYMNESWSIYTIFEWVMVHINHVWCIGCCMGCNNSYTGCVATVIVNECTYVWVMVPIYHIWTHKVVAGCYCHAGDNDSWYTYIWVMVHIFYVHMYHDSYICTMTQDAKSLSPTYEWLMVHIYWVMVHTCYVCMYRDSFICTMIQNAIVIVPNIWMTHGTYILSHGTYILCMYVPWLIYMYHDSKCHSHCPQHKNDSWYIYIESWYIYIMYVCTVTHIYVPWRRML